MKRRPTYGIGPNPDHPGTKTIYANLGFGWKQPICGRFTESENLKTVAKLRARGFQVVQLTRKDLK